MIAERTDVRFNVLLHEKEIATKTPPFEWSILAEAHVESRLRPGYSVFDVFDLCYAGVTVIDVRWRDGDHLMLVVVACLGGVRAKTWEEGILCTLASARAEASASLRAVELSGEVPISTVLATKAGLNVSSGGGAANAASFWIERRRRRGRESMMTQYRSCS